MIRKFVNIGDYKYLIDLLNQDTDNIDNITHEYVMIRNFSIMNSIINDTHIYIFQKSVWKSLSKELDDNNDEMFPKVKSLVFPIPNTNITGYSVTPMDFNMNFNKNSFYKKDKDGNYIYGNDIYPLVDYENKPKRIKCNLLRIYHPNNKTKLKGIICIDNYINNIHWYYFCQSLNNYTTNSETEITYQNQTYSEYIELHIPNIDDLFKLVKVDNGKKIFNVYFNENLNTVVSAKNENFITNILSENSERYMKFKISSRKDTYFEFENQLVPLNLLLQPYRIIEDEDPVTHETHNVKLYLNQQISIENNYITNPFNITIFPYDKIDTNTNTYQLSKDLSLYTDVYNIDCKFELKAKLGFDENHKISILSKFKYPKRDQYIKNHKTTSEAFKEAYKYYNNIDQYYYDYYWVEKLRRDFPEREEYFLNKFLVLFDNQGKHDGTENYVVKRQYVDEEGELIWEGLEDISTEERLRRMIQLNYDGIYDELRDWEIEEDFETGMDFLGFRIQIASDGQFKNLVYNQTVSVDFSQLDDFSFNINNIYDHWYQLTDLLIARTIFIDRILNRVIYSNPVVITKEYFKYIINDDNIFSFNVLNNINDDMKEIKLNGDKNDVKEHISDIFNTAVEFIKNSSREQNNEYFNKAIESAKKVFNEELDNTMIQPFNFINNINCIIKKEEDNNSHVSSVGVNNIIYKPIFYRTQELQNIKMRANLTQNIGINLGNYMNKVDTFKIIIEGIEFVEFGRNDIYVIFSLNSNLFQKGSGVYTITNQDDEYISSGKWIIY